MKMRFNFIYWFFPVIFLITFCGEKEAPVNLVAPGISCSIMLDMGEFNDVNLARFSFNEVNWTDNDSHDNAVCINALAAIELQNYMMAIFNMSSSDIPIVNNKTIPEGTVIYIGNPPSNSVFAHVHSKWQKRWKKTKSGDSQGFRFDTFAFPESTDFLVLSGRTPVGALYAVYELLDRWGVRWVIPGENGEIVPEKTSALINPSSEYVVSANHIRGFVRENLDFKYDVKNYISSELFEWMGRNRLNYIWQTDTLIFLQKQYGIITNCGEYGEEMTPLNPDAVDVNNGQNLSFKDSHPDWYNKSSNPASPAICVSNSNFTDELSSRIIYQLSTGDWKNADNYILRLVNNTTWCDCEKCEKTGNDANKLLHLLGILQNGIDKAYKAGTLNRDVQVSSFVDLNTLPPSNKPDKNLKYDKTQIILVPTGRCYTHPLADTSCKIVNAGLWKNLQIWLNKNNKYKGSIYFSELYNTREFRDLPVVFSQVMQYDLPIYNSAGIEGLCFTNPRIIKPGVHTMMNYQFARESWNPAVDVDSLRTEFFKSQYSGAYDLSREYYKNIEKIMANISAWKIELAVKMRQAVIDSVTGPLLPLTRFSDHFVLEGTGVYKNSSLNWETTYQGIYETRFVLLDAMLSDITPQTKDHLKELSEQLKYAELLVNLYDNVIRFLTLGEEEPEMKIESLIRLEDVAQQLDNYVIQFPALGVTNGLDATGIRDVVNKLLTDNQKTINLYKSDY